MRQKLLVIVLFFSLKFFTPAALASDVFFIQNKGQWPIDVLYRTEIPGGYLFLKKSSLVYVFYDQKTIPDFHNLSDTPVNPNAKISNNDFVKAHGVSVNFENIGPKATITPILKIATAYNYYLGDDSKQWASDVAAFEVINYKHFYEGIDLRLYWHQNKLKYEFVVSPGANPSQIKLRYEGATKLSISDIGQLIIQTSINEFKEKQPYSFQKTENNITEVNSKFELKNSNIVSFNFPNGYNASLPLVIDPELIFSTFSGSVPDNWGHTATYDSATNLYAGGTVFGVGFPVSIGAFQTRFQGLVDVAILKFNPDGSELLYATYLGGSLRDIPTSLFVNTKQELLILGITGSTNFPTSANAFQKAFGGGSAITPISGLDLEKGSDIFISKLSENGKQLLASSYYGGAGNDGLSDSTGVKIRNYGDSFRGEIVTDKLNRVWITSSTNSENLPLKNPINNKLSGRQDGLVARLSPDLSHLEWATYIGGSGFDAAFSLKVSDDNNVYVVGSTTSTDLKVHKNAYQPQNNGLEDAFVAHFNNDLFVGTSYLGTEKEDGGYLIDLGPEKNVYVYGLTRGKYPVTAGVYRNGHSGQFIQALNANLTQSIFSTTIGSGKGTPDISPTAFLVNTCGNIYLSGWGGNINIGTRFNLESSTENMTVTADALQPITNGNNFYIAILEQNAKSLLYATYFGNTSNSTRGDHVDGGTSRFSKDGVIYHATCACDGSRFPTTPKAWSQTNRSKNCNNAAFKIDIDRLHAAFDVYAGDKKDVTKGCAPLDMSFVNMSEGGVDYIWEINGGTISREAEQAKYTFKTPGSYTVTLKAYNRLSCKRIDVAEKQIIVEALNIQVMPDTMVCENSKIQLYASGGEKYSWTPAEGLDNSNSSNPTFTVKESTTFNLDVSTKVGCKATRKVQVKVFRKDDFIPMPSMEQCVGVETPLTVNGSANKYQWFANGVAMEGDGKNVNVKPDSTTTYMIIGQYQDGCRPQREIIINIDRSFMPVFDIAQSGGDCNQAYLYSMENNTKNASHFTWDLGEGTTKNEVQIPQFLYETAGEYIVSLTAINSKGCALTTARKLKTEPPFTLANVVTPNGDGKNDIFIVPVPNSKLEIFNRWGKQVFKSTDYQNDWGKGITNGSYFYVVDTPLGRHCKGWLEVLE